MRLLSVFCAIWFALMGGFFFAFSTTVMPALHQVPPSEGLHAMQQINETVTNPGFAAGFWIAILLATAGLFAALIRRPRGWLWLLGGCLLYIVGAFMVTAVGNVPLNKALAPIALDGAGSAASWAHYEAHWGLLNYIRMFSALLAAFLTLMPLISTLNDN